MFEILSIIQLILAILLIISILIQRANTDASGAYGTDGTAGMSLEKRGVEKKVYTATILLIVLFIASILFPLLSK
jgi:protein translocase SecG subunit